MTQPSYMGLQLLFAGGGAHQLLLETAAAKAILDQWLAGKLPAVLADTQAVLPWGFKTASIVLIGAFEVPQPGSQQQAAGGGPLMTSGTMVSGAAWGCRP